MSRSMQIIAEVKQQMPDGITLGYTEVEWLYAKMSPSVLQRVGFSHRGAKELMSGQAISDPKDRKVAALIIGAALK